MYNYHLVYGLNLLKLKFNESLINWGLKKEEKNTDVRNSYKNILPSIEIYRLKNIEKVVSIDDDSNEKEEPYTLSLFPFPFTNEKHFSNSTFYFNTVFLR